MAADRGFQFLHDFFDWPANVTTPEPCGAVPTCRHQRLPIGAEARAPHLSLMPAQDLQFLARGPLPEPGGVVPTRGHQRLPIGAEARARNLTLMATKYSQKVELRPEIASKSIHLGGRRVAAYKQAEKNAGIGLR